MSTRALILSVLLLAACSSDSSNGLVYYWNSDPRSLDPALSTDVVTGEAAALLFDNLTQFNPDGKIIPGLAKSWTVSPDGLTWTFQLRSGVSFHDGQPLTASTVESSLLRALGMAGQGARLWALEPIVGAIAVRDSGAASLKGLQVVDDTTLAFSLVEPLNIFPKLLAMPVAAIVPAQVKADFGQAPVGSGPWRFLSWSHDDQLVLVRNPNWWGGSPRSDTLTVRIIPEMFTQAAEYESGRLSVVEVPVGETSRWRSGHSTELQQQQSMRAIYVAINTTRGPLTDVRVRRALNQAVNIPAILAQVAQGRGVAAAGSIPPGLDGYNPDRKRYDYNPEAARALLQEAGYPSGLKLQLWRSPRADFARIAEAIQADLGRIGVAVEIVERDAATGRSAARKGEVDLFLADWWADYPDGENFTWPLFRSSNAGTGGNYAFLRDPALDQMLDRARSTTDSSVKAALLQEIDQAVFEAAPWIFCWFPIDLWAVQPEVSGWRVPAVFTGQRWNEVTITR